MSSLMIFNFIKQTTKFLRIYKNITSIYYNKFLPQPNKKAIVKIVDTYNSVA